MNDLEYIKTLIVRDFEAAENVLLKRDPEALQNLIEAKQRVIDILDYQIRAEK